MKNFIFLCSVSYSWRSIIHDKQRTNVTCSQVADKNFDLEEDFLWFLHCKSGLSGKALSETLLGTISDLKLGINGCRELGYDQAATVSENKNGMTAHMIKKNPKANYTHCFSHRLNLSICKTCKI